MSYLHLANTYKNTNFSIVKNIYLSVKSIKVDFFFVYCNVIITALVNIDYGYPTV